MRPTEGVPAIEVESIADSNIQYSPLAFAGSLLGERTHGFVFVCEARSRRYAPRPRLLQEIIAVALHTVLVHCRPSNQPAVASVLLVYLRGQPVHRRFFGVQGQPTAPDGRSAKSPFSILPSAVILTLPHCNLVPTCNCRSRHLPGRTRPRGNTSRQMKPSLYVKAVGNAIGGTPLCNSKDKENNDVEAVIPTSRG